MPFYHSTINGENIYNSEYFQKPVSNKCLVLDLDNTLVKTFTDDDHPTPLEHILSLKIFEDPNLYELRRRAYILKLVDLGKSRKGSGDLETYIGFLRPGTYEFLDFIHRYFQEIYVYSAGNKKYVDQLVEILFRDYRKPKIVYSRDDCVKSKDHYVKPLTKIYNATKGKCSYLNTYIIDDLPHSISANTENGILIPRWDPKASIESLTEYDDALLRIKDWLLQKEVILARDIRFLEKRDIFD